MFCIHKVEKCRKDKSITAGFRLPSSTYFQHNEALAAAVSARLWPDSPRRRELGYGLLQLDFVQKTDPRWTDGSQRAEDTSEPNWVYMLQKKIHVCCFATQTEELLLLLAVHSPQWPWTHSVFQRLEKNNAKGSDSCIGMLILFSNAVKKKGFLFMSCSSLGKLLPPSTVFVFNLYMFPLMLLLCAWIISIPGGNVTFCKAAKSLPHYTT